MSYCEYHCYEIGGGFIAENPACPIHGDGGLQQQVDELRTLLVSQADALKRKDAEIAELRQHAEAMHEMLGRVMPKLTPANDADLLVAIHNERCAYRAAHPKE